MTNYKTLEAWKKSMQLVKDVYLISKTYPKEELFSLTVKQSGLPFLSHQILLRAVEGGQAKTLFNFYTYRGVRYMN